MKSKTITFAKKARLPITHIVINDNVDERDEVGDYIYGEDDWEEVDDWEWEEVLR